MFSLGIIETNGRCHISFCSNQIKEWIRGVREYLYEFIITGHMGNFVNNLPT